MKKFSFSFFKKISFKNLVLAISTIAYCSSVIFLINQLLNGALTITLLLILAAINIFSMITIIYFFKSNKKFKDMPKIVENPWSGKTELVPEIESAKSDPEGFKVFASNSLASTGKKLFKLKPPNPFKPRFFRKAMRLISAILIFMYTIVFFFSIGNIMSIMFFATDLVLFYMIWLTR